MNKKIALTIVIIFVIVMMVIGIKEKSNKSVSVNEDLRLIERIELAETFNEITDCSSYEKKDYPKTDDEKNALSNKAKEYILNGNKINGIYYFNYYFMDNDEQVEEIIAIDMIGENGIYVIPINNIDKFDINNIEDIENINDYQYEIIEWDAGDASWNNSNYAKIRITMKSLNSKFSLELDYAENDGFIYIYGDAPSISTSSKKVNEIKSEYNKENLPFNGKYYKNEQQSIEEAKLVKENAIEKRNEKRKEENILANSIPKVGMSESEVLKTKWGTPNKKNKDTYSWGTTEQWVYDKYGYVYFENGIVTSVSEK